LYQASGDSGNTCCARKTSKEIPRHACKIRDGHDSNSCFGLKRLYVASYLEAATTPNVVAIRVGIPTPSSTFNAILSLLLNPELVWPEDGLPLVPLDEDGLLVGVVEDAIAGEFVGVSRNRVEAA
jgi:hypothetical protein